MSTDILVSVALCKCTVNPVPGVLDIRVLLLPLGFLLPALVLIVLQPSIHVLVQLGLTLINNSIRRFNTITQVNSIT